jgi:hypothetical protein
VSTVEDGLRVARSYTRARRMPWVQGKIGDWVLPFGPYTPAQIGVGFGGSFLLIKTYSLWHPLAPVWVPAVLLGAAVWAVRRARIGGRTPLNCALGLMTYLAQPRAGRIDGRAVRMSRPQILHGGVVLSPHALSNAEPGAAQPAYSAGRLRRQSTQLRTVRKAVRRPRSAKHTAAAAPTGLPARPTPTAMQQMPARGSVGAGSRATENLGVRS